MDFQIKEEHKLLGRINEYVVANAINICFMLFPVQCPWSGNCSETSAKDVMASLLHVVGMTERIAENEWR